MSRLVRATRLGLADLGRGWLLVVDSAGSVKMYTFGPPVRWTDPMPESEPMMQLTASAYPKGTVWSPTSR